MAKKQPQLYTLVHYHSCRQKATPWEWIFIQAPLHDAEDVMRKGLGIEPYEVNCREHETINCEFTEDVTLEGHWLFGQFAGFLSILIMREDYVPYFLNGMWKGLTRNISI